MATQHLSSALSAPAASRPYRRANTGYGKQTMSGQVAAGLRDFAFLPERERYVAAYVDHLPDGAAMDIKSLAKDLPLYGQMAIGTALRALGVAGHLRRVRRRAEGGGPCRWVTLTFWSRTAHDNEWWTARLEGEAAACAHPCAPSEPPAQEQPCAPSAPEQPCAPSVEPRLASRPDPVVPRRRPTESTPGRPPSPAWTSEAVAPADPGPDLPVSSASLSSAPQGVPVAAPPAAPPAAGVPPVAAGPSPAYVALAELGRREPRLALSAADCAALEPLAAAWFTRGVSAGYLTSAIIAGLPEQVGSPVGLVRRRLTDKMPPHLPATPTPPPVPAPGTPDAPARRLLVECTDCGRPARAEALPDGLCASCRKAHQAPEPAEPAVVPAQVERDVPALVAGLRNLMRTP
ncbi:MarR family transcriptional regulator [Streptomyces sp. NPDC008125]|uniref:MarR family transcriptional regulator n=1 Tax=Streptomyces sp. NPDC008125 TaxID=3364811 RepID=UPI0036E66F1A